MMRQSMAETPDEFSEPDTEETAVSDLGSGDEITPEAEPPEPGADRTANDAADTTVEAAPQVVSTPRALPYQPAQFAQEDSHFADDIKQGHIKPETLQSLYAKQDTTGKVGTLFGLLLSGMGSGLSGQPNAVLEMMNRQIQNDLEAQKATAQNKQNWYRLNLDRELNKAQIGKMGIENKLTEARTTQIPAETKRIEAETKSAEADARLKAITATKNQMLIDQMKRLGDAVDKMPDGPNKANAQNALMSQVQPAVQEQISNNNIQLAGQLNLKAGLRGELPPATAPAVDFDRMKLLKAAGDAATANGMVIMPGRGMSEQDYGKAMQEAASTQKNRSAYEILKQNFEDLDKQAFGGRLKPENFDTIKAHTVGQLVNSGMPKDEAHDLANSMLPSYKDFIGMGPNARVTKAQQMYDQFRTQEGGTSTLDSFRLKAPFPGPPQVQERVKKSAKRAPKKEAAAKPPAENIKIWNGKKYRRGPNGESILVEE